MIWLVGNKGMLGSDVEEVLLAGKAAYVATDLDLDITSIKDLKEFSREKEISWIINCSAYTAVDRAEDEPESAEKVNGTGVRNIAEIARDKNARVIHLSTDYVFDGLKDGNYNENDAANPQTAYGLSKLNGERLLSETWNKFFIIRISWLFGKNGNNFVYTMLRLFNERDEVKVVNDQWGSPTYTRDVSELIFNIIMKNSESYGIYHYTCQGKITWFDFARAIYEKGKNYNIVSRDVKLTPIETKDYPTKAKRPCNSYLSKDKISKEFKIKIPRWEESLDSFLSGLKKMPSPPAPLPK